MERSRFASRTREALSFAVAGCVRAFCHLLSLPLPIPKALSSNFPENLRFRRLARAPPPLSSPMERTSSDSIRNGAAAKQPTEDGKPPARKVVIKSADMLEDMQKEAIEIAIAAFEENSVEKDVAEAIKKEYDKKHGPTWHCIVGRNFGSYVTHETNHFVYFYLDQKAILLFKSG